jgi:hypothetical protein
MASARFKYAALAMLATASLLPAAASAHAGHPARGAVSPRAVDRTPVTLGYLRNGVAANDLRFSVLPGTVSYVVVVAYAYNAEGQRIIGPLATPVPLSFAGTALSFVYPTSGSMTFSPSPIIVKYLGSTAASAWGLTEVRGGSGPVPFDLLQTGLPGYGNPATNSSVCSAAALPLASGYPPGTTSQADTQGCVTVAPLVITPGGALGPDLTLPLDVPGQFNGTPLEVQQDTDVPISFFEARTGSGYEPEVANTTFSFSRNLFYNRGACEANIGPPHDYNTPLYAGAWNYWYAHGWFYGDGNPFYWSYGGPNCGNYWPPSGVSSSLTVGPNAALLPWGANVHGDWTAGATRIPAWIGFTDGRVTRLMLWTITREPVTALHRRGGTRKH